MNNFYKQYPAIKEITKQQKRQIMMFYLYILPIIFIVGKLYHENEYSNPDNIKYFEFNEEFKISITIFVGVACLISYLGFILIGIPFLKRTFQKGLYLLKYGQKAEAVCKSIEHVASKNGTGFNITLTIKDKEISRSYADRLIGKGKLKEAFTNIKEGDTVQIIHNPYDIKDFDLEISKYQFESLQ